MDVLLHPTGGKEYYYIDESSIALQGLYSPQGFASGVEDFTADLVFSEPLTLWEEGQSTGQSHQINTSGSVIISPTYGTRSASIEGSSSFLGMEEVIVPYGTFTALHTSYELTVSIEIEGFEFEIDYYGEFWLVEGLGVVKRISNGITFELESYTGPYLESINEE